MIITKKDFKVFSKQVISEYKKHKIKMLKPLYLYLAKLYPFPASIQDHHKKLGGLVFHLIETAQFCFSCGTHYSGNPENLLMAGLMHDIGKIFAFDFVFPDNIIWNIDSDKPFPFNKEFTIELNKEKMKIHSHYSLFIAGNFFNNLPYEVFYAIAKHHDADKFLNNHTLLSILTEADFYSVTNYIKIDKKKYIAKIKDIINASIEKKILVFDDNNNPNFSGLSAENVYYVFPHKLFQAVNSVLIENSEPTLTFNKFMLLIKLFISSQIEEFETTINFSGKNHNVITIPKKLLI